MGVYKNIVNKAEEDLISLKKKSAYFNKKIISKKREIERLKIRDNDPSGIVVTDHAILRYIERVVKVDIEKIKDILRGDNRLKEAINTLHSGTFPIENFKIKVIDRIIVTVIKNKE